MNRSSGYAVCVPAPRRHEHETPLPATQLARGIGDRLALLIHKLGNEVLLRAEEPLEEMGLTPREYLALVIIDTDAPASQAQLAELMRLLPAQVVPVVDDLERAGLVERRRADADRRRSVVRLTAKGRRLRARADALAARIEDDLLGHLDPGARARLHDALRQAALTPPQRAATGGAPGARAPAA
jgi:MarR family transcriptional regulator, lower aerobic nicotinate degradation pathway regulator